MDDIIAVGVLQAMTLVPYSSFEGVMPALVPPEPPISPKKLAFMTSNGSKSFSSKRRENRIVSVTSEDEDVCKTDEEARLECGGYGSM